MTRGIARHSRRGTLVIAAVVLAGAATVATLPATAATRPSGTVRVLSAGSWSNVMVLLGAAFTHNTGYRLVNTSMGSSAIAHGVTSQTLQGDVFISASTGDDRSLEGAAHCRWIDGYTDVGTSPVVLAYYRGSRFAAALRRRPWYDVVSAAGFELGRTDPAVDPGGVLDLDALRGLGYAYDMPSLLALARVTRDVYTEQAIPGLLQAGQLDAAFMYAVSADAAQLPYVALTGTRNLNAHFTVALLRGAPDPGAAAAFLHWLFTRAATSLLVRQGVVPVAPRFVPAPT